MKVSELKDMGLRVDITVDLTLIDDDVKRIFHKKQHTEKDYINDHLNVISGKYESDTHILSVITRLDEDIKKEYKTLATSPIKVLVEQLAEACKNIHCDNCPYAQDVCILKKTDSLPYMWSHLLD